MKQLIFILSFLLINVSISAQVIKRDEQLKSLEEKLKQLSETMPGLKEEIDLSVSDVNIQDFIHAIAQSNKINIHINPDLDMRVNNNFSDVSVSSILIFLCKQYNLDIEIYNNILSISKWVQNETQSEIKLPKELDIRYNANKKLISMDLNSDTLSRMDASAFSRNPKRRLRTPRDRWRNPIRVSDSCSSARKSSSRSHS